MKNLLENILLVALVLAIPQIAWACSCDRKPLSEEVKSTPLIFVGKVIERRQDVSYVPQKLDAPSHIRQLIDSRKRWILNVQVTRKFKGVNDDELNVTEIRQDGPCEPIWFDKGDVALFFAYEEDIRDDDSTEVSSFGLCSRTQHFDEQSVDYRALTRLFGASEVGVSPKHTFDF